MSAAPPEASSGPGFAGSSPSPVDLRQPGSHPIDAPVTCVLTRLGLRSVWHLIPTYIDYRRVVREIVRTKTPGFLRSAFLVEDPTTCYTLSIWTGRDDVVLSGTNVPSHVVAARRTLARLRTGERGGPELWSSKWRLAEVSNNLNWAEFDLRALLLTSGARSLGRG